MQRIDQIHGLIQKLQEGEFDTTWEISALFAPELRHWISATNPYRKEIMTEALEELIFAICQLV